MDDGCQQYPSTFAKRKGIPHSRGECPVPAPYSDTGDKGGSMGDGCQQYPSTQVSPVHGGNVRCLPRTPIRGTKGAQRATYNNKTRRPGYAKLPVDKTPGFPRSRGKCPKDKGGSRDDSPRQYPSIQVVQSSPAGENQGKANQGGQKGGLRQTTTPPIQKSIPQTSTTPIHNTHHSNH